MQKIVQKRAAPLTAAVRDQLNRWRQPFTEACSLQLNGKAATTKPVPGSGDQETQ